MAVRIGSARIDEHGNTRGGAAGNQTGKELSFQNWYAHKKKWRVFRAKDPAKRKMIGDAMCKAVNNKHIGYDQAQRNTLYYACKDLGFDPSKVSKNVETDCSALVRVCCNYAGIKCPDMRTATEPKVLLATGEFEELTASKYTAKADYLGYGFILCTASSGHTVVVVSNGSKYENDVVSNFQQSGVISVNDMPTLSEDDTGEYVVTLQNALLKYDSKCLPLYGADGDFGSETTSAVKAFQSFKGLEVDGIVGKYTWDALHIYMLDQISVTGNTVNIRSAAGTDSSIVGSAKKGDIMRFEETATVNNVTWYHVNNGWISGKYSKVV